MILITITILFDVENLLKNQDYPPKIENLLFQIINHMKKDKKLLSTLTN